MIEYAEFTEVKKPLVQRVRSAFTIKQMGVLAVLLGIGSFILWQRPLPLCDNNGLSQEVVDVLNQRTADLAGVDLTRETHGLATDHCSFSVEDSKERLSAVDRLALTGDYMAKLTAELKRLQIEFYRIGFDPNYKGQKMWFIHTDTQVSRPLSQKDIDKIIELKLSAVEFNRVVGLLPEETIRYVRELIKND